MSLEPQLNILIVEDNPGDMIILSEHLKSTGLNCRISHASFLHEAIETCKKKDFGIILLDLGLPDSFGLNTLKQMSEAAGKAALVVMTGLDDEIIALESLRQGAQDYLVKNRLTPEIIFRTIKYSIERKKIIDIQVQNARRFSMLSAATGALNEFDELSDIFRIICAGLRQLLDDAVILAVEFPEQNVVRLSGIELLEPQFDEILRITGRNLRHPVFNFEKGSAKVLSLFENKKLKRVQGGIYEAFNGHVNEESCEQLNKLFNINHVYTIGFQQYSLLYGGFIILSEYPVSEDDRLIIETIGNHTSLNIHRRIIERHLRFSEERYRKLSFELEQKVKERTKDIALVNEQLQKELTDRIQAESALKISETRLKELNATKDKFFNIVAHDLKNPFTSLLGSSELLFESINHLGKEKIKELAVILNNSAKSGYAILQNLLDWSRSQTGVLKMNREWIPLRTLIDENIHNQELFSSNKDVTIHSEINDHIQIYADKNMVSTILRNLISNALKFSYRSGVVIIKAKANKKEIEISVKDFGTGIPEENIDKLFRIDTRYSVPGTENEQGTGLGLKLCREFVEKQGGRIWVESEINKGSEFTFTIPVKAN